MRSEEPGKDTDGRNSIPGLITERTRAEARLIAAARKSGVPTPVIHEITGDMIRMERIYGSLMKDTLRNEHLEESGRTVGSLHRAGILHGDLTTSNMVMRDKRCVLIDFGLAGVSSEIEARGVDLHVLFQTLESTTDHFAELKEAFSDARVAHARGDGPAIAFHERASAASHV